MNVQELAKELFAGGDVPKDQMSKEWTEEFQIPIYGNGLSENGLYGFTNISKVEQESITISARGTIGFPIFRTAPFYPIVRLIVLIPKSTLNAKYIFYFLKSVDFTNTGTSIPQLTVPQVKQLNVPIAPLPEQQRIVAKLDAVFGHLDSLREKLDRIPELLKNFRQQVLTQAVTGELTREWREGKEFNSSFYELIEKFHLEKKKPVQARGQKGLDKKLSLFKIPEDWRWIPQLKLVKDGANSISAGPFGTIFKAKDFREKGVPIIFLRHVKKEGFNQSKPNFMDENVWKEFHQDYSIEGGELLVTKLGDPPGEATIYPKGIGVAMITPDVMKSDLYEDFALTAYVSYFFNSSICKEFIASISFGMTRLRIDLTMFKSFPIPLPTLEEQTEIVNRVEKLFDLANSIESKYKSLKVKIDQLPQAVLAKAFRGELVGQEVKEYEIMESEIRMVAEGIENYPKH